MAIIIDVPVDGTWVDVNTTTGIVVGSAMEITNKGTQYLYLAENSLEPSSLTEGKIITTTAANFPTASITAGSLKIWARCPVVSGTTISVQDFT